ncbi:TetR/AcrR family transcriptional regulator [Candidatus Xianfuyuplasma coldseepsis]|uniref:TetR/AcrR family transcriptional regulator n=1 Tax=Candidatus Xianfuyuplasma coldseepsis TaxID=2782163 RepID=A0A7L7KSI9_9MOLU|nr:TetR/AcrR family transcriptional regulator [Xianfuyuplasma coldseepsis]QMS84748.1 TetR/AcrR family transcriptional regulator [Xianfuyuplasma coldseepsis]
MPKDTFLNLDTEKQQRVFDAAIDEFAEHSFNEAKLSRIIKTAKIPRGSFYQYFEDKTDLYKYVFQEITKHKLSYFGDDLQNPEEISFIDLFRILYQRGLQFALDNPKYIQITRKLMSDRGRDIFNEVMGRGLELAKEYYLRYIEIDKKHGRIRNEIDSDILADFIVETTTTLSLTEFTHQKELNVEHMFHRIEQFLLILQKGIEKVH